VNEFVLTKSDDFNLFLSYYDSNKSSFSIAIPEGDNAITISSIHRSKGLEYPVVISPFVSWTHQPKTEQLWFDLKPFDFDVLQLDENRSLKYYYGKVVPNELNNYDSLSRQKQDEFDSVFLDALNMLYVAFTRPKQHLHILLAHPHGDAHPQTKNAFKNSLGQIVLDYCLSKPDLQQPIPDYINDQDLMSYFLLKASPQFIKYNAGIQETYVKQLELSTQIQNEVDFRIQTNQEDLYTSAQSRRERGEKVHDFLSKIRDNDYYKLHKSSLTKQLDLETVDLIDALFNNESIRSFFLPSELLFSERDILCPDGEIIRPDRVIQKNDITYIIDFKTGKENKAYVTQMEKYKNRLALLGFQQVKAILIYIESQKVEEV
jgi:ATP-dependent exoDNAse (exonuclease V) beta subunit